MTRNEAETRKDLIDPILIKAGWGFNSNISVEYNVQKNNPFTDGQVEIHGKNITRGQRKFADYLLFGKNGRPIAVVEAKAESIDYDSGIQQAETYARMLDVPYAISSNGKKLKISDMTGNSEIISYDLEMEDFPSPEDIWQKYLVWKGLETPEFQKLANTPYYFYDGNKKPRYYQRIAIDRTVDNIIKGKKRNLLVMATGTGKTLVAFQLIWRLWKSGVKKRILFLADRNILINQTKNQDFAPFGDAMTKIENRNVDTSYEIFLALYQGMTGKEEFKDTYKDFTPNFFDLIVIDECHRGSTKEDSNWRAILDYFSAATQVGLTATPKETKEASNSEYFGDSIYTYSLKQGISDGFLAPYKVIKVTIDKDVEDYIPNSDLDDNEMIIEKKPYNRKDFDRTLVLGDRTKLVAKRVSQFLKSTDRFSKTIVFCVDIEHAKRMTMALINENQDEYKKNSKYIMQVTGDEKDGKDSLPDFINPKKKHPVITVTSKLMTTGVDAKTCKVIVLDSNIESMTEFKQIIGRGTRINEEYDKFFFNILDFRNATHNFHEKEFDGEAVKIKETSGNKDLTEEDGVPEYEDTKKDKSKLVKNYIRDSHSLIINETFQKIGSDGNIVTDDYVDYSKEKILSRFSSMSKFVTGWNSEKRKLAVVEELSELGINFEDLYEIVGKDLDPFDLICHIAYGKKPLTRRERTKGVRKRDYFTKFEGDAKEVLLRLVEKYENNGLEDLEDINVLKSESFSDLGSIVEIVNGLFKGKNNYLKTVNELEDIIYNEK
jgi:type I restriction enzyme R subunit